MGKMFTKEFPQKQIRSIFSEILGISKEDIEDRKKQLFYCDPLDMEFKIFWGENSSIGMVVKKKGEILILSKNNECSLLCVPFMTKRGKDFCSMTDVSWFDLSGNAHIITPRLRIIIEGKPNRFKKLGRPVNLFAPKSSRVTRWLLMKWDRPWRQREIAYETGMSEAFVSQIVKKLVLESYVQKRNAEIIYNDWQILFNAWYERYDFSKHTIIKGHIVSRSPEGQVQSVHNVLKEEDNEYALTGLAAAWRFTEFANFRITTFFVSEYPSEDTLKRMKFRQTDSGANTWLVIPNDEGVFQGGSIVNGVPCVHPIQVYMDLKGHPERSPEAQEILLTKIKWEHL